MTGAPAAAGPTPAQGWLDKPGRRQFLAISAALFLATFAIYWYLGPQETPYAHQVNQANNLIHGHLNFVPEHTLNLQTLERVYFDGEQFCLPPNEAEKQPEVPDAVISEDCKIYMQHALGPALIVIPGVLIWGNELNQTLVSVVIAAMTAPLVFAVSRHMSSSLKAQLALTVMMMFGTILFWVGANGGVWFFAHTTAVFFLFAAIFFTVGRPNPLLAGLLLGAAVMCRPTVVLTGLFFVIMFSNLWLQQAADGVSLVRRINPAPLLKFAAGAAPFLLLLMLLNYARFNNPFETGYNYGEQVHQIALAFVYPHGTFDLSYITRHPPVIFEQMPIFQDSGPYVLPSWAGMAIWATTPAFFYAFFPNLRNRWWAAAGALALGLSATIILLRAVGRGLDLGWGDEDIPLGVHLLPFWLMTGAAVGLAIRDRDRLSMACWAAIIPTALVIFFFAATGWAQFGYRYALDFTPFLWLLVAHQVRDHLRWHHVLLIAIGVAVNLMGVLWIYQFEPDHLNGWTWVMF